MLGAFAGREAAHGAGRLQLHVPARAAGLGSETVAQFTHLFRLPTLLTPVFPAPEFEMSPMLPVFVVWDTSVTWGGGEQGQWRRGRRQRRGS